MYTAGVDVGSSVVKIAMMSFEDSGEFGKLVAHEAEKIRKRDIKDVIWNCYDRVLSRCGLGPEAIAYVASTGEGERVDFRKGHFYSMTCHARGALHLAPSARAVVDMGALHSRVLVMDARSRVLAYRMTSQCASGSGQFLENIARYLGVTQQDIGNLSIKAERPETPSGICAVLAETDVINMVSRGITTPDILKGVHLSMARRIVNFLKMLKAQGNVLVTGGLANDTGFVLALRELAGADGLPIKVLGHELSIQAGALGAAIWAAFRHVKLRKADAR